MRTEHSSGNATWAAYVYVLLALGEQEKEKPKEAGRKPYLDDDQSQESI